MGIKKGMSVRGARAVGGMCVGSRGKDEDSEATLLTGTERK